LKLVSLTDIIEPARRGGYAVGAYNYCNAETVQAIIEQGCNQRSPVILIIGPWELPLLGIKTVTRLAEMTAADASVPVCLHLDHATEFEMVKECIDAGFPSVMIDASQYDFEENIRRTKAVVEIAHPLGITVEGELGAVGRVDDGGVEGGAESTLTDPARAAEFVERTGVDALATSIGNAHGMYKQLPELDFDRLEAIQRAVDIPLVLHGGSGTPRDQLHRAIDIGICKVNVATELALAYLEAIRQAPEKGRTWYAHALMDAKAAAGEVVARWMVELGSAGRV